MDMDMDNKDFKHSQIDNYGNNGGSFIRKASSYPGIHFHFVSCFFMEI